MRTIVLVLASMTMLLFAASEIVLATPVAWWLYVACMAMFALGVLRKRHPRDQPQGLVTLISICVVAAILYLTPWSSRNGFLKHLRSIKPGMTVTDVNGIMRGYMQGTGIPPNPFAVPPSPPGQSTFQGALVFRHSEEPAYNADWGIVNLKDGRVTSVEFSAD